MSLALTKCSIHPCHGRRKHPNVAAGGEWIGSLGRAAEATGLGVQLCMSHTRHVIAGARLPHITQTRASNDYKEMNSDQWDIGRSSLFADALGTLLARQCCEARLDCN